MAKAAKSEGTRPGPKDPVDGVKEQAQTSAPSKFSGTARASAIYDKGPYPLWSGPMAGDVDKPKGDGDYIPAKDPEGYEHKVSDTGRLLPFSENQAIPEGYHPVAKNTGDGSGYDGEHIYHHGADVESGPSVTKPGIPGAAHYSQTEVDSGNAVPHSAQKPADDDFDD